MDSSAQRRANKYKEKLKRMYIDLKDSVDTNYALEEKHARAESKISALSRALDSLRSENDEIKKINAELRSRLESRSESQLKFPLASSSSAGEPPRKRGSKRKKETLLKPTEGVRTKEIFTDSATPQPKWRSKKEAPGPHTPDGYWDTYSLEK